MKRLYRAVLIALLLLGVYISYVSTSEADRVVPLSEADIRGFTEERNTKPLDIENFEDEAVILFEDGTYTISKQKNGELFVLFSGDVPGENHDQKPVEISVRNSENTYLTVVLEDESLIEQAHRIEVADSSGKSFSEYVKSNRGFILADEENKLNPGLDGFVLSIYGENGGILFEKQLQ